jgi:hypothetical protein
MPHDPSPDSQTWPLGDLVSAAFMLAGLVLLGTCFALI